MNGDRLFSAFGDKGYCSLSSIRGRDIALYGTGQCAHWFHEIAMKVHGIVPRFAIDRQPTLEYWWGIPTKNPEAFKHSISDANALHVIVCVGRLCDFYKISEFLRDLGVKNIYFWGEFIEAHFPFVGSKDIPFTLDKPLAEKIYSAFERLDDELSRKIFCLIMQIVKSGVPSPFPCSSNRYQYFPEDVELTKGYESYVCCGSYDGENIRKLAEARGEVKRMFCFEPEPKIFEKLSLCAEKYNQSKNTDIRCNEIAVTDGQGVARFQSKSGLGSHISPSGDIEVKTIDLDTYFSQIDEKPTFISMDIEGEELRALRGARRIISLAKPDLAICVYHNPSHVWEALNLLSEFVPEYMYSLRNYTGFAIETVLYASIKESDF
ncbi:FkbM family methyltransferase [Alphaproteobacteria bacterium]|nr:FkbM family methyltransferase [Alphaproteobacteria bacterium]